ncbi:cytidine deaminase family protein [Miniphocaeibacter massiliensis]|uniref:cytidine deaminase family protein n=1 Tax=Miniphocaeibacter massiliensis TaxID=2041841 RepID=UPI000C08B1D7|nr:cytidine deaminase [Miniphocaeibacter massiliensis]
MDIWEKLYLQAKEEYNPNEVSPFIYAHHVVSAVEMEDGRIYTGFCIESACGVMDLCAERVAILKAYMETGETTIKRLIAFRDVPPKEGEDNIPCGACREFLMQLNEKNKETEILIDYEKRKTLKLKELLPIWWREKRYKNNKTV